MILTESIYFHKMINKKNPANSGIFCTFQITQKKPLKLRNSNWKLSEFSSKIVFFFNFFLQNN